MHNLTFVLHSKKEHQSNYVMMNLDPLSGHVLLLTMQMNVSL